MGRDRSMLNGRKQYKNFGVSGVTFKDQAVPVQQSVTEPDESNISPLSRREHIS